MTNDDEKSDSNSMFSWRGVALPRPSCLGGQGVALPLPAGGARERQLGWYAVPTLPRYRVKGGTGDRDFASGQSRL